MADVGQLRRGGGIGLVAELEGDVREAEGLVGGCGWRMRVFAGAQ